MTRFVCLWLPNWPLQRQWLSRPELKGAGGLALERPGPRGSLVAACCAAAAARGARPGMPLAEAASLVPRLAVAPYDPAADRAALEKLAEACEAFSPSVALEEGPEPESLLWDVSNLGHLLGPDTRIAARLEEFCRRLGYRVRIAVAPTRGLAWGLAHFGSAERPLCCEAEEARSLGAQLAIEALRPNEETISLLHQLGIDRVGQLLALPRDELGCRFGKELLRRVDQFTGGAAEVVPPHRAPPPLVADLALDELTADRDRLAEGLAWLMERLATELAARDEGAVLILCRLRCVGGDTVPLRIGLVEPSAQAAQWMELAELHLDSLQLADEVAALEVRVAATGRLGERQGELFVDGQPTDPRQWALLVNRLSSRLGYERVVGAAPRSSPLPERGYQYVPATASFREAVPPKRGRRPARQAQRARPVDGAAGPRPLWLYPAPQPLEVVSVAPDGPPQLVWFEGSRQTVAGYWGPERMETLWWRGRSVGRDYYRVALRSGSVLWVFRRLATGRWFLHGLFQ